MSRFQPHLSNINKNVVYYGVGTHKLKEPLKLEFGQTLYLAAGCVLKGAIETRGDNIAIRGRGILDGAEIKRFQYRGMLVAYDCDKLLVEGIILRNAFSWTLITDRCKNVKIENVKICGSRMFNDDAFDFCNSSNVSVRDCFARAQDDIIAVKGKGSLPCDNITVENCIFWTDCANIFRIGYEYDAAAMKNMNFRDIYVPFYSKKYNPPESYWSNTIVWLQPAQNIVISDVHFENVRMHSNGDDIIMLSANPRILKYKDYNAPGKLRDCSLKNFIVEEKRGNSTVFSTFADTMPNAASTEYQSKISPISAKE